MIQKDNVFSLRIKDTQKSDVANYTITLTNQRGEYVKSSANITVQGMTCTFFVISKQQCLYKSESLVMKIIMNFLEWAITELCCIS